MGIDGDEALGLRLRQRREPLRDSLLESDTFVTDPIPNLLARQALVRINGQEHHHAGPDPKQAGLVGVADLFDTELTARSLIRKR